MWFLWCLAICFPFTLWIAWDEQHKQRISKKESIRARNEADSTRRFMEEVLAAYYESRKESYADFDKILRNLPDPSRHQPDYYQIMESMQFDRLPYALSDEPLEPISCGIMDFEKSRFHWNGRGSTPAWKRGGWLFMPKTKQEGSHDIY
jgi:hypothetical protein